MADISGIILAGGASARLGQDKALVEVGGEPLVVRVVRALQTVVEQIVVVTNRPEALDFLGLPMVGDIYPGIGTLGGLHAGLSTIKGQYGLAVGCDMPFLNADLLRYMTSLVQDCDIVMPHINGYFEPLHAIYATHCRTAFEKHILAGQRRILLACEGLRLCHIRTDESSRFDPEGLSFFNVNTLQDMERMQEIVARQAMAGS